MEIIIVLAALVVGLMLGRLMPKDCSRKVLRNDLQWQDRYQALQDEYQALGDQYLKASRSAKVIAIHLKEHQKNGHVVEVEPTLQRQFEDLTNDRIVKSKPVRSPEFSDRKNRELLELKTMLGQLKEPEMDSV